VTAINLLSHEPQATSQVTWGVTQSQTTSSNPAGWDI
jgi:hypothetical protein